MVEGTIAGFDDFPEARYDGGDAGTPSSSLNGTAMARMGVVDDAAEILEGHEHADKRHHPGHNPSGHAVDCERRGYDRGTVARR